MLVEESLMNGFSPGQAVAGFVLDEQVRQLEIGPVFHATDQASGVSKTLTLLAPDKNGNTPEVLRMKLYRAICRLSANRHNGLAPIETAIDANGVYLIVQEDVRGITLAQQLQQQCLSLAQCCTMLQSVVQTLRFAAREMQLFHGRLRPDKILLSVDGNIKILDLGTDVSLDNQHFLPVGNFELDAPNMLIARYMAPEQHIGLKNQDQRSDIFALGLILIESVAGELPLSGSTIAELFASKRRLNAAMLRQVAPSWPAELINPLAKCLHPDQRDRFGSYDVVENLLNDWQNLQLPEPKKAAAAIDRTIVKVKKVKLKPKPLRPAPAPAVPSTAPALQTQFMQYDSNGPAVLDLNVLLDEDVEDMPIPLELQAMLEISEGADAGAVYGLEKSKINLGRVPDNNIDIVVRDGNVSRLHAVICYANERFFLVDKGSTNGTLVNGEYVQSVLLSSKSKIVMGNTAMAFTYKPLS